jgi:PIN domain nuclease of toxin-antitoxin system
VSILIDTHVLLWAGGIETRLSRAARGLLEDPELPVYFSAASAWEIAIKWSKGLLDLPALPSEVVENLVSAAGLTKLAVTHDDALSVAELPYHHKDPFDRLLVAQARRHGLRLMTADPQLERYDVDVIALWLNDDDE